MSSGGKCWPRHAIREDTRVVALRDLYKVQKGYKGTIWQVLRVGCRILWDNLYEQAYRLETVPLSSIAPIHGKDKPSGKAIRKLREYRRQSDEWHRALEVNWPTITPTPTTPENQHGKESKDNEEEHEEDRQEEDEGPGPEA